MLSWILTEISFKSNTGARVGNAAALPLWPVSWFKSEVAEVLCRMALFAIYNLSFCFKSSAGDPLRDDKTSFPLYTIDLRFNSKSALWKTACFPSTKLRFTWTSGVFFDAATFAICILPFCFGPGRGGSLFLLVTCGSDTSSFPLGGLKDFNCKRYECLWRKKLQNHAKNWASELFTLNSIVQVILYLKSTVENIEFKNSERKWNYIKLILKRFD